MCNPACLCLSEQHFTEVVQGEEFLGLSLQQVCSLISSDKLTVSTEEKVRQHNVHTHFNASVIKALCLLSIWDLRGIRNNGDGKKEKIRTL